MMNIFDVFPAQTGIQKAAEFQNSNQRKSLKGAPCMYLRFLQCQAKAHRSRQTTSAPCAICCRARHKAPLNDQRRSLTTQSFPRLGGSIMLLLKDGVRGLSGHAAAVVLLRDVHVAAVAPVVRPAVLDNGVNLPVGLGHKANRENL